MGQVTIGTVVLPCSHVEYMKVTVTLMMIVLDISHVEKATASHHSNPTLTAAMTLHQVREDFSSI